MARLTVLRSDLAVVDGVDLEALEQAARAYDAKVVTVTLASLGADVYTAIAEGPVLMVVSNDREASHALSVGVDEILRVGEVTRASIDTAVERARVRSDARMARELGRARGSDDEESSFSFIGSALRGRLVSPLSAASIHCELLSASFARILEVSDDFVAWASLATPNEEMRRLVARRLAAPSTTELNELFRGLAESLHRAESLTLSLDALARNGAPGEPVVIANVFAALTDILAPEISPWATLEMTAGGRCTTSISRVSFVLILTALIGSAVDAIRASGRKGHVGVRALAEDDTIVLEVSDTGAQIVADLRPNILDPYFEERHPRGSGLLNARERARRAGGDLLVDTDADGTTVRVFLPVHSDAEDEPAIPPKGTKRDDEPTVH